MLRAGPFSDERVIRLINRRFVALYFDLDRNGALADNAARDFVLKIKPELGNSAVSTPPVLVLTPDGESFGEIDNYATEEQMLSSLHDVLAKHVEWNQPSDEEQRVTKAGTPIERANLLIDLGEVDAARKLLATETEPAAAALLAHCCRLAKDWNALEQALPLIKGREFEDDARVEEAWRRYAARDFAAAKKLLADFPKESERRTEARYLAGLASWHAGKKDEALATWKSTIESCSQDPWIYRADWAYTQAKEGASKGSFSTAGAKSSLLGRIGYMGRRNPDLDSP